MDLSFIHQIRINERKLVGDGLEINVSNIKQVDLAKSNRMVWVYGQFIPNSI